MLSISVESGKIQALLRRLEDGDPTARDDLTRVACERLRPLAHHMLKGFPGLRRWEQSDDVFQNAMIRLHQALEKARPTSARHFRDLAAMHIRWALIDLTRHHFGKEGAGGRHSTNAGRESSEAPRYEQPDCAADPVKLAQWAEFHSQVDRMLPEHERAVLNLVLYLGLEKKEAAAELGIGVRAVQKSYASALLKLGRFAKDNPPPSL